MRLLATASCVRRVVVAAPADEVDQVWALASPVVGDAVLEVVPGGQTRSASVLRALETLPQDVSVVLVHDAARPVTPVSLVEAVDAAVRAGHGAVVPGLGVADTIKQVGPSAHGLATVTSTVDRSVLRAVQTPQGFRRDVLDAAYAAAVRDDALDATDDAGLVERTGGEVVVVPGDELAFKVTRPLDLVLADAVLSERAAAHGRLGT